MTDGQEMHGLKLRIDIRLQRNIISVSAKEETDLSRMEIHFEEDEQKAGRTAAERSCSHMEQ